MKKLSLITAAVSAFALSFGALAATNTENTASGPGPRDTEDAGKPANGAAACSFIYSIQKIGPTLAEAGQEFTYHVFVRNLGNCRLRRIDLKDVLPEGVDFVSATPSPSYQHHNRIVWDNVMIPAGQYLDAQITVKAEERIRRPFYGTNTACAYTPWIGTRICDSQTTLFYRDRDRSEATSQE
jgi:uncharacterized repeat protein (TIGR01451 family)